MATPSFSWPALVAAIRGLRPAVRMKWCGNDEPPPWEAWIIVSSISYLETGQVGPVPFEEVEWVEIDPRRKNERGRLVDMDQTAELSGALAKADIPFDLTGEVFRIPANAG